MKVDCKHYESRTYAGGEMLQRCKLDLAPDAPWSCPEDCPAYQKRALDLAWSTGSLAPQKRPPAAPAPPEDAVDLLREAASIVGDAAAAAEAERAKRAAKRTWRRRRR